jgi:hypothetical protein
MANIWRVLTAFLVCCVIAGCAGDTAGVNRADTLGLIDLATPQALPQLPLVVVPTDDGNRGYRTRFAEQWMARSDVLCRQYKDKLMMVSRDIRFTSNVAQLLLSGVATFVTPLSTAHALAGAATMVGGVGAEFDADFFQKQSGEILASAIQTARDNQANQIEINLAKLGPEGYSIYRVQRDVTAYHNMCSLETALAQIRLALKVSSPDAGNTPPAAQGEQASLLQAITAEASHKAAIGAMAGAAEAQRKGLPAATGAALGAGAAVATPNPANAAVAGKEAVSSATPPAPSARRVPGPRVATQLNAAAARKQLYLELGQGAEGKQDPDQVRVGFMKQCWQELPPPAPTNFGLWIDSAGSNELTSVTNCIRRKVSAASGRH